MSLKTSARPWIAVGLTAALAATACSSSKNNNTNTSPTTLGSGTTATTGAAAPTGAPIKLTTIYQGKSGLAVDATLPDGAMAAVKEINSTGGINGRPLEYTPCDDQGDNTRARTCATTAIADGAIAAVGTVTTEANIYLPLFAQAHMASIGSYANAAQDFTSPASFPLIGGTGNSPGAVANALVRVGAKKVSLAHIDTGTKTIDTAAAAGLKPFGLSLVATTSFPANPPDMAPYVAAARAHGADGVEVFALASDVISFVRELRSEGSNIPVGVVTNDYPQVFKQLGSEAVGLVDQNDYYPNDQTQIGAVRREVAAFQAAGVSSAVDDPYAWNSYASVMAFAAVAKKLPSVTRESVTAALGQTSGLDIGLTAPLQFVTGNKAGLGARIFNNCVFLTQWTANGYKGITPNWIDPSTNTTCPSPSSS